jgi:hypothetical protein
MRFPDIIEILLASISVKASLDELISMSSMIPNVFQVLTINIEGIRVMRVDLAEHIPEHFDLF